MRRGRMLHGPRNPESIRGHRFYEASAQRDELVHEPQTPSPRH
jgi:hypothetical protein